MILIPAGHHLILIINHVITLRKYRLMNIKIQKYQIFVLKKDFEVHKIPTHSMCGADDGSHAKL